MAIKYDQICLVSDKEIDKSDQLACIRYKNHNVWFKDTLTSQKFYSNPKLKSHRVTLKLHYERKKFCNQNSFCFSTAEVKTQAKQAVLGL